ncbi:hypothetical protein Tco_1037197 [Tanacetum coccineum]
MSNWRRKKEMSKELQGCHKLNKRLILEKTTIFVGQGKELTCLQGRKWQRGNLGAVVRFAGTSDSLATVVRVHFGMLRSSYNSWLKLLYNCFTVIRLHHFVMELESFPLEQCSDKIPNGNQSEFGENFAPVACLQKIPMGIGAGLKRDLLVGVEV